MLKYLGLDEESVSLLKYSPPQSFKPEPAECHLTAWCQLRERGGSVQHGWVLAQAESQSFSEAIFHTVWRSPEGRLVDITPRSDGEKRLLFAPDGHRAIELATFNGRPAINTYDNVRMFGTDLLAPLERITVVMQSGFAQRHGLPW